MNQDKTATFIGFAIKAGGCVTGSESVSRCRKKIFVLFLSRDTAANTTKEITLKAAREKIPLVVPQNKDLADLVHKANCKTAAITHRQLAESILESIQNNEQYKILGGNN